jgi:hypothetical protein
MFVYCPGAHRLHGTHTVSVVAVHRDQAYNPAPQTLHSPHWVSWVALHARTRVSPDLKLQLVQGLHTVLP